MDSEQLPGLPGPTAMPPSPPTASQELRHSKVACVLAGFWISFLVLTVLYGLQNACNLILFMVICTAGLGLIPIAVVSWLVGWIAFSIWDWATHKGGSTTPPVPMDAGG